MAHWKSALLVAPIWFCGQYLYNVGLATTSVTSSTVISTTSCVSTFVLSVFVLNEGKHNFYRKLLGVGCCVGGNVVL